MDLATLVRTMSPSLMSEVYVFITLQHNDTVPSNLYQRFYIQNKHSRHLVFNDSFLFCQTKTVFFVLKFYFKNKSVSQYCSGGLCFDSECYLLY